MTHDKLLKDAAKAVRKQMRKGWTEEQLSSAVLAIALKAAAKEVEDSMNENPKNAEMRLFASYFAKKIRTMIPKE